MTKEQMIRELSLDMMMGLDGMTIKYDVNKIKERATRYVEQFMENVSISKIDMLSAIKIKKFEISVFYYEVTFAVFVTFKNEFSFSDTIFMIIGKDGE